MKQYGLIGYPLQHSFSPQYFANKFKRECINAQYAPFALKHINDVEPLLRLKTIAGLNVTIPYKESVIPFLDQLSPAAAEIGAVNTIVFKGKTRIGHNTDAPAFEQVLVDNGINQTFKALVFGTGGASKAVVYALKKLNINYTWVSRKASQHTIDYNTLNNNIGAQHTLWINTTPVGQHPNINAHLPLPFKALSAKHVCIDLIYNPAQTVFLSQAKQANALAINGLSMLHYQAEKAWKLWNE